MPPTAHHESDFDAPLTHCPLCRAPTPRRLLTDLYGHHLDRCRACSSVFMNPQYSDAHQQRLYSGYINLHPDEANHKRRRDPAVRTAGKTAGLQLLARYAPVRRRILMVGCGDGLELQVARDLGWQPEGYDVDPATTAAVAAQHDVTVHCGAFAELPARAGPFDAVFLDQVIEHPKDPAAYLRTCRELLCPGGVLYLGTPNIGSLSNQLKTWADRLGWRGRGRLGKHFNTRHHLFFFAPGQLARLLRRHFGLEVCAVRNSCKPQRNLLTARFGRLLPCLDSSFVIVARRP